MANESDLSLRSANKRLTQAAPEADEFTSLIQQMSTDTKSDLMNVITSLIFGKACLKKDENGTIRLEYSDEKDKSLLWYLETSEPGIIQQPKSDKDCRLRIKSMVGNIEHTKNNCSPGGIVFDTSKITVVNGKYEKKEQFKLTGRILGKEDIAGDILEVKDFFTKKRHAMKVVPVDMFKENEVMSWMHLNKTGLVPKLYLIRREGNNICFHFEKVEPSVTLKDILDKKYTIPKECCRFFSYWTFKELLTAVKRSHETGWTHGDLHAGNVMIGKPLGIKFKVSGKADKMEKYRDDDILQCVILLIAIRTGKIFNSADLKNKFKKKLAKLCNIFEFSEEDKKELVGLCEKALKLGDDTVDNIISETEIIVNRENVKEKSTKVEGILFKESYLRYIIFFIGLVFLFTFISFLISSSRN